jgi:hypothetical protein
MAGKVIESIETLQGDRCVDLVEETGTYRYREFRRDFEDAGRWTPMGPASSPFESRAEAISAAAKEIVWLAHHLT